MSVFLAVDHVHQVFNLPGGGQYIALKDVSLNIRPGEFISLIGHSGCGKSTLLNLIAGLTQPSSGGIILEGRQVTEPGPDRMVVFQNYSLLPWRTVRQNIALAVDSVLRDRNRTERRTIIEETIDLVGLRAAADKYPHEISGGMKQRVAIARGLAIRPKLLLLDEPFGALDALTRGNLQEQLMRICQESGVTAVMVTHDVDEALLLSDRVVMLTNGPAAQIGQILEVDFPRPRQRLEMMETPHYYELRNELINFLQQQRRAKRRSKAVPTSVPAVATASRQQTVRLGFLPGNDCAPLAIAKELGLFQDVGLEVELQSFLTWESLEDSLRLGQLNGALMMASQPLAMTMGLGGHRPLPIATPLTVSRNGGAIAFSRRYLEAGVRSLEDLRDFLAEHPQRLRLAIPDAIAMPALLLRYWLASIGLDPDRDVELVVMSPYEMVEALKAEEIDGFAAGEMRIALAVQTGAAYVLATDLDIWAGHPEKVLGLPEAWLQANPEAAIALCSALLKAGEICDDPRQRDRIVEVLQRPQYLGSAAGAVLKRYFDFGLGGEPTQILRFNQFHVDQANYPNPLEGTWLLTQLCRWGLTPLPKNRQELLDRVYRRDIYEAAIASVGFPLIAPSQRTFELFDAVPFNPDRPLQYLEQFEIKAPIQVAPIPLATSA
ncbi:nitrate ABC transporter ATP-binding protein [Synechococcus elongatus]|uniref:nitrate ABC transporter ATP-binding protein n=1 Tax=Synechococcus elongatus TaxID=32046 RepID=UPI0030CC7453